MKLAAFSVTLLCVSIPAHATSIKEFWQSRPADSPRFSSTKSIAGLEMCLGMEMSDYVGAPHILHGEGETVITLIAGSMLQMPVGGVRVVDHGTSRELIVGALQSGGWTNKVTNAIRRCI